MKVLQKALILLLIPLLFEVMLVGVLLYQNTQLEEESKQALAQKSIGQAVALLFFANVEATDSVYWLQAKPNSANYEKFQKHMERVLTLQGEANRQIQVNKLEKHPAVVALLRAGDYVNSKLVPYKDQIDERHSLTDEELLDLVRECNSMTLLLNDCGSSARELWEWERHLSQELEQRQRNLKEAMHTTIVVGLSGNILLSILMAVWFNHTTITRLRLIMGNARLIGSSAPLTVSVTGRDEFSELDLVLHKVADLMAESRKLEIAAKNMKEDFYAMVAHDLRSPLTSVGVAMELLLDGAKGPLTEAAADAIGESSRNLERVYRLVNDFLDLRKLDAKSFEINLKPVSVDGIVTQCAEAIADAVQEKELKVRINTESTSVKADASSLARILLNILNFVIASASQEEEMEILVTSKQKDQMVRFEVRSFGTTLGESERQSLFDAFQAGAAERSGLALAVARLLVELHGGEIGIDKNQPSGNVFWFTIPTWDRSENGA